MVIIQLHYGLLHMHYVLFVYVERVSGLDLPTVSLGAAATIPIAGSSSSNQPHNFSTCFTDMYAARPIIAVRT